MGRILLTHCRRLTWGITLLRCVGFCCPAPGSRGQHYHCMHRFIRKACFAHGNSSHFFPGTYWSQGLGEQQQQKSPLPPHLAGFIPTPHTQSTYNTVQNLFLSRRQLNPGGDVSLSTGMCLCPRARRGTHKGGGGCGAAR